MTNNAKKGIVADAELFFDYITSKFVITYFDKRKDENTEKFEDIKVIEFIDEKSVKRIILENGKKHLKMLLENEFLLHVVKWIPSFYKGYNPHLPEFYGNGELITKNMCVLPNHLNYNFEDEKKINYSILKNNFEALNNINLLLNNLFPENEHKHYFINWIGYIVQTLRKTRNSVVLLGEQGTGKGVLYENIIQWIFGQYNTVTVSNSDVKSDFNAIFDNRLFVLFNEIKADFREGNSTYETIKAYITDDSLMINTKNISQFRSENHFNCMFFSNNEIPLQIEGSDRRYSVFKTSNKKLKEVCDDVFKLIKEIKSERNEFLKLLKILKVDKNFALSLFHTEQKTKIMEQSNTRQDLIKHKFIEQDFKFFEEKLDDFLDGKEEDFEIKEIKKNEAIAEKIYFSFKNSDMKKEFLNNLKFGGFSNEILKWFYKIFINEDDSEKKVFKFWNYVFDESWQVGSERTRIKTFKNVQILKIFNKEYKKVGEKWLEILNKRDDEKFIIKQNGDRIPILWEKIDENEINSIF